MAENPYKVHLESHDERLAHDVPPKDIRSIFYSDPKIILNYSFYSPHPPPIVCPRPKVVNAYDFTPRAMVLPPEQLNSLRKQKDELEQRAWLANAKEQEIELGLKKYRKALIIFLATFFGISMLYLFIAPYSP